MPDLATPSPGGLTAVLQPAGRTPLRSLRRLRFRYSRGTPLALVAASSREGSAMFLKQFFVEGLGHASYLIASEQTKEAAVIDPGREIAVYLDEARAQGLHIRYVCETHVHNDFVSGAAQL